MHLLLGVSFEKFLLSVSGTCAASTTATAPDAVSIRILLVSTAACATLSWAGVRARTGGCSRGAAGGFGCCWWGAHFYCATVSRILTFSGALSTTLPVMVQICTHFFVNLNTTPSRSWLTTRAVCPCVPDVPFLLSPKLTTEILVPTLANHQAGEIFRCVLFLLVVVIHSNTVNENER